MARIYKIETDRLVIRCYTPNDAAMLKAAVDSSIEHLLPWMHWAKNEPETIEKKIERLRTYRGNFDLDIDYTFGIFNKNETVLLGSTGLHTRIGNNAREIGYWISASQIQQGYATECCKALIKTGFEIEMLERIEIHCDTKNTRSSAIPQKLGFVHEATLHKRTCGTDNKLRDVMIWTLFKEDYPNTPASQIQINAFDVCANKIM